MDHNVVYKAQILPLARNPFHHVTTYLLCRNTLLRNGIAQLLTGSQFALSGEASTGVPDLPATDDTPPTLILICESLSPEGHAQLVKELKDRCPGARLVLLTDDLEPRAVWELLNAGLNGVCPTVMSQNAMLKALELVMLGETFLPASVGLALLNQPSFARQRMMAPANDQGAALPGKFSDREAQILRLLTTGASNKIIARELGLAEATIKVHIKAILRKAKAANRTQAAMWATQQFGLAESTANVELVG